MNGSLILGDPMPDVPAALRTYQESIGLPVTGQPCGLTVWELRREQGRRPDVDHVICPAIPSSAGSQFLMGAAA